MEPEYSPGQDGFSEGRLCYRGHYVAGLMTHPRRLTDGVRRQGGDGVGPGYSGVVGEAAKVIQAASASDSLGVLISGNLPMGEIAATARFFQSSLPARQVSVLVPPSDEAMLRGLSSEGVRAGFEEMGQADSVLVIGDVLGTHPVLARSLLDIRQRNRRAKLITVDTIAGRTARFATTPLQARHGSEVHAATALALAAGASLKDIVAKAPGLSDVIGEGADLDTLLNHCGLARGDVEQVAAGLCEDEKSVILLANPPGRCGRGDLVAAAAECLAQAARSKLLPLYTWGGSVGALAVSRELRLAGTAAWLAAARAGEFSAALVVGCDPVGMLPRACADDSFGKIEHLVVASAMPNATTEKAEIVLPLAFWFEMDGESIDHNGNSRALEALAEPPGAADTPRGLVNLLAERLGVEPVEATGAVSAARPDGAGKDGGSGSSRESGGSSKAGGRKSAVGGNKVGSEGDKDVFVVTSRTESLDLFEGSLSRQLDWVSDIEPEPVLLISPADAASLGVCDRDVVGMGDVELCARVSSAVPVGTVAVPPTVPGVLDVFGWQLDAETIAVEPGRARLRVLAPASCRGE